MPKIGKTVAITGANTGMGKAAALALAKKGYHVFMLSRSDARGRQALEEVRKESGSDQTEMYRCDLGSLDSIAACAESIKSACSQLDVLINNAGVITWKRQETDDGFERQLGVNHLGHFALTLRLRELLAAADAPRVVNVSSGAHKWGRMHWDDPFLTRKFGAWKAYGQSKWANILFAMELAARLRDRNGVSFSLHPGMVSTDIGVNRRTGFGRSIHRMLRPFFLTPEQGAETAIYLADSDEPLAHSGKYFYKKQPATIMGGNDDLEQEARKLWEWSERVTGLRWESF